MDALPIVGVSLAFSWACPSCSVKQYADAVITEFSEEDKAEAAAELGEAPRTGEWVSQPEVVTCTNCGQAFETANSGRHAPA